jgi:glycosyltransferase involved in cell wall biosynthesis
MHTAHLDDSVSADVTILLSHYNCLPWLERAIVSIYRQTYTRWRLLVVDDSSDSVEPLRALKWHLDEPRTEWLRTTSNVGQFRIYNLALRLVRTPFFMLQDADDWSAPERLGTLLNEICTTRADIVGSWVQRTDSWGRQVGVRCPPVDVNRALRFRRRGGIVIGPTLLCRTEFVRALGGFDGTTRIGGDTDLICRAVFRGRVRNFPGMLYSQMDRSGSLTNNPETGFNSRLRRSYARALGVRFQRRLLQSWLGLGPSGDDLRASANDLEFSFSAF